jgi:hypothetical protein
MSLCMLHNLKQKQKHMTLHFWLPWFEPRLTDLKPGDFVEVIQLCFFVLVRVISKAVDCGIVPDGNTICPKQSPISVSTYKNIICLKTAFPVLWTHECAQLSHKNLPIFHNVVSTLHVYQVIVCKLVQHCAHIYAVKLYFYSQAIFWHVLEMATTTMSCTSSTANHAGTYVEGVI